MNSYTEEPQPFCFRLRSLLYLLLRIILIKHRQGSQAANQNRVFQTQANQILIVKYFMQRKTQHFVFATFEIHQNAYTRFISVNNSSIKQKKDDRCFPMK